MGGGTTTTTTTTEEHIAKQIASGQTWLDVLLSARHVHVQHSTAATNWLFIYLISSNVLVFSLYA